MKLKHVVLHTGKCRMEVLVEDPDGRVRLVEFTWYAKVTTDVPPLHWWNSVVAEVELSRANELAAAQGRTLV